MLDKNLFTIIYFGKEDFKFFLLAFFQTNLSMKINTAIHNRLTDENLQDFIKKFAF